MFFFQFDTIFYQRLILYRLFLNLIPFQILFFLYMFIRICVNNLVIYPLKSKLIKFFKSIIPVVLRICGLNVTFKLLLKLRLSCLVSFSKILGSWKDSTEQTKNLISINFRYFYHLSHPLFCKAKIVFKIPFLILDDVIRLEFLKDLTFQK